MTFSKFLLCISVASVATVSAFAEAETKYDKISNQLVSQANTAMSDQHFADAQLFYERALVANPASITALIGLGRAHEGQGRVGKGLKYYRQALEIEPNDQGALEVQALAFLKRDMIDRADNNREKLARLCSNGCPALASVETALKDYQHSKARETAAVATKKDG